ncbi:hypothetical protein ONS95_005562 [Cadophora gregata]|uniref:uncharacterized protein n=1 Tax=Cadophora gregata TaxID=51156 RepID=UPI0026DD9929|nr:uncharacterized protein ONS95_005562 [Cadophora gregata]KAK0103543.1 hypothetical protein ONS95_005562 [Cadophora gregata]KAK0107735.1 hypothetical protein ONS96_003534 [Cadophora gregata f. sp. sojae]
MMERYSSIQSSRHPAMSLSQSSQPTFSETETSPTASYITPTSTRASQSTVDTQSSVGVSEKTLQFDTDNHTSPTRRSREKVQPPRRYSHDSSKINGYTTCGRHGDDWLFGGFSVLGAVKKLWEKDTKE